MSLALVLHSTRCACLRVLNDGLWLCSEFPSFTGVLINSRNVGVSFSFAHISEQVSRPRVGRP